ncbi:hypothetical protein ALQ56_200235 [Pseudomonas syringae pv. papulans]|nr:hypothetical protein ALQ56_200235 [Pseudomonas syringae pv. papulans]
MLNMSIVMNTMEMPEFAFVNVIGSTEINCALHINVIMMIIKGNARLVRAPIEFTPKAVVVKNMKMTK